jgi:hypothetical protein
MGVLEAGAEGYRKNMATVNRQIKQNSIKMIDARHDNLVLTYKYEFIPPFQPEPNNVQLMAQRMAAFACDEVSMSKTIDAGAALVWEFYQPDGELVVRARADREACAVLR